MGLKTAVAASLGSAGFLLVEGCGFQDAELRKGLQSIQIDRKERLTKDRDTVQVDTLIGNSCGFPTVPLSFDLHSFQDDFNPE